MRTAFLSALLFLFLPLIAASGETAIEPQKKADPAQLKALLDTLGSDDFEKREKATEELMKLGAAALDAVAGCETETADAEVKARCAKIREAIGDPNATALAVLDKISESDAVFVRPGASRIKLTKHYFTGPEFAKHLRSKAAALDISLTCAADEFIEKTASTSVLHGGPYKVSFNDGTEKELRVWLGESLKLKLVEKK